jgi:hypothetical protein
VANFTSRNIDDFLYDKFINMIKHENNQKAEPFKTGITVLAMIDFLERYKGKVLSINDFNSEIQNKLDKFIKDNSMP